MERQHGRPASAGTSCDGVEQEAVTLTSGSDTHLELQHTHIQTADVHYMSSSISLLLEWTPSEVRPCDHSSCDRDRRDAVNGRWWHHDPGLHQTQGFTKSAPWHFKSPPVRASSLQVPTKRSNRLPAYFDSLLAQLWSCYIRRSDHCCGAETSRVWS